MRIGPCTLLLALSFAPALHLQAAYVLPGMVISKPNPVYPPDAKAAHRQGSVVLHFTVTKAGTVENLTIVSGPEEFRQSAIDAVSEWKYRPYRQNGEPVEKDQTITINFAMDNSSAAVAPGAPVLHPQAESAQTAAPAATSAPAACTCPSPTVAQRHLPPYSAKQKITRVQTLANGTNITTVTTSQVWRDADGRTRTDTTNTLADGTTYHYIRIYDQANRVQLTWTVGNPSAQKIVNVYHYPQPVAQPVIAAPLPIQQRYYPTTNQSLPPQTIEGLYATGNRNTRTIPAGYEGNDRDMTTTTENWYSQTLGLQIRSITDDPRNGKSTMEITDIQQTVPDPALFKAPEGYQIKETNQ